MASYELVTIDVSRKFRKNRPLCGQVNHTFAMNINFNWVVVRTSLIYVFSRSKKNITILHLNIELELYLYLLMIKRFNHIKGPEWIFVGFFFFFFQKYLSNTKVPPKEIKPEVQWSCKRNLISWPRISICLAKVKGTSYTFIYSFSEVYQPISKSKAAIISKESITVTFFYIKA